jgi:hypothetical protein
MASANPKRVPGFLCVIENGVGQVHLDRHCEQLSGHLYNVFIAGGVVIKRGPWPAALDTRQLLKWCIPCGSVVWEAARTAQLERQRLSHIHAYAPEGQRAGYVGGKGHSAKVVHLIGHCDLLRDRRSSHRVAFSELPPGLGPAAAAHQGRSRRGPPALERRGGRRARGPKPRDARPVRVEGVGMPVCRLCDRRLASGRIWFDSEQRAYFEDDCFFWDRQVDPYLWVEATANLRSLL